MCMHIIDIYIVVCSAVFLHMIVKETVIPLSCVAKKDSTCETAPFGLSPAVSLYLAVMTSMEFDISTYRPVFHGRESLWWWWERWSSSTFATRECSNEVCCKLRSELFGARYIEVSVLLT